MARGDAFQIDEGTLAIDRKLAARKAAARTLAGIVVVCLAALAAVIVAVRWLWLAGLPRFFAERHEQLRARFHSLSSIEALLLLGAMAAVGGVVWLLANFPRATLSIAAWGTLTWCGWTLGAAVGDTSASVAGAILIGATVAVSVADSIYRGLGQP